jgi:hypothetical protein
MCITDGVALDVGIFYFKCKNKGILWDNSSMPCSSCLVIWFTDA